MESGGDRFAASRDYLKAYARIRTSVLVGLVLSVLIFIGLSCETYSTSWVAVLTKGDDMGSRDVVVITGLWQTCFTRDSGARLCLRFDEVPVYVDVCRALMIIACITCMVAFICTVIGLKKDAMLLRLAGVFLCLSGLLAAAAVITFPICFSENLYDDTNNPQKRYMRVGYGIISTSVTAVMCWITAILVAMPSKRTIHHEVRMLSPESQSLLYRKY